MTLSYEATIIDAHQRSYETAIQLIKGHKVTITKQDMWDDTHLWLWCVSDDNQEGWVPDSYLSIEGKTALALCDYDAMELTVKEGEKVTVITELNGWCLSRNAAGEQGWIPAGKMTRL